MTEYTFLTAHTDGRLLSVDGDPMPDNMTVTLFCSECGYEIEHAALCVTGDMEYWHLIAARVHPHTPPTEVSDGFMSDRAASVIEQYRTALKGGA